MLTFIVIYHGGVVITNEIGSYEFVRMKKETFLLNEFLFVNMIRLVREWLSWMDEDCEVLFEGRIDINLSNGPRIKTMSPVCDEKEWKAYVGVVMKSEIRGTKSLQEWLSRMILMTKVLSRRLCLKWLMSSTSNVALCLLNCHKKLRPTLIQRSPIHWQ
jgi:hypothetical protein